MKADRNNKHFSVIALALSLAVATPAWAGSGNGRTDYAKVLDVEPIVHTVEDRIPRESCWTEQVRHEDYRPNENGYTGTILGGVIGGAVGNAVGHKKKNKQVGAAVGALLGAAIGHDVSQRNSGGRTNVYYTSERQCETSYEVSYREETVGYWVTYQYHGEQYRTRMDRAPGDKIRVRVTVEPI